MEQRAGAEMPFLDHLEELRWRILWSLLALVIGVAVAFLIIVKFDALTLIERPIAPLLPAPHAHAGALSGAPFQPT